MSAEAPVLQTIGLGVRYGGVQATEDVSLSIAAGTIAGLIGPNAAGKTTLVDAVTGFTASTGQVLLDVRSSRVPLSACRCVVHSLPGVGRLRRRRHGFAEIGDFAMLAR